MELLRDQSSAIERALREQESAIRDTFIRAEEQRHEPPRVIASAIAELRIPKEERDRAETAQENRHRQNLTRQKWLTAFTALAFLSAAIYAGIAAKQLHEMRRTNDLTKQALDKSDRSLTSTLTKIQGLIDATTRLAGATERANEINGDADRPWVGATFRAEGFERNSPANFYFIYANTGRRPAKIIKMEMTAFTDKKFPLDPDSQYRKAPPTLGPQSTAVIVPGGTAISRVGSFIDAPFLESVFAGGQKFFVIGRIDYKDILTQKYGWATTCIQYVPSPLSPLS